MPVALVDFTADYDGGTVEIRKGVTHVAADHDLTKRFPDRFGSDGSGYARSGARTRSKEDTMNERELLELDRRERRGEELEPGDVRRLREWRNEREDWLRERAEAGHTEDGAGFLPRRDELSRHIAGTVGNAAACFETTCAFCIESF